MPDSPRVVIGIAWFRSDQWELLRSLAADVENLEDTHAQWEALAYKTMRDLARQGITARKVDVDVNELQAWCLSENRPLDRAARSRYAVLRLPEEG